MRRLSILVLAAMVITLLFGPTPARAQDILGLSVRPTDLLPAGTARGSADILRSDAGGYLVSVDLSSAAEALVFDDYAGASAWVVWVVDMDGVRHNLGALDENLVLEDARTDGLVARVFVTAESAADVTTPSENRIFEATLRAVTEEATEAKPEVLPTTGSLVHDLMVLVLVAVALVLTGLRLRAVRV